MTEENPPFAELFWGGYLTALHGAGAIGPGDNIEQIKADFMAGLRGERMPCETEARTE